ncbi:MAG: hypothetical protein EF811_02970, partial [Methanonatronarchaeia archaeon]
MKVTKLSKTAEKDRFENELKNSLTAYDPRVGGLDEVKAGSNWVHMLVWADQFIQFKVLKGKKFSMKVEGVTEEMFEEEIGPVEEEGVV